MHASSVIALFGEAAKGDLDTAYFCKSVEELFHYFGEPPPETKGLYYAIQTLLYQKAILYFRVREEGLSIKDYLFGLHLMRDYASKIPHVGALFLPQVGAKAIIDEGLFFCESNHSLLLIEESDLYDYLTDKTTKNDSIDELEL